MSDFDPTVFEFEYRAKHRDARFDERLIASIPKHGQLLDAGCGAGRITVRIAEHARMVYGIDISEKMLALARARQLESNVQNIRWTQGSIERLPFGPSVFDAVFSSNVLQFVDIEVAFPEFKRVLKSGGKLILDNWTLGWSRWTRSIFRLRQLLIAYDVLETYGLPTAFKYVQAKRDHSHGDYAGDWRPLTPIAILETATRFFPAAVIQRKPKRIVVLWEKS